MNEIVIKEGFHNDVDDWEPLREFAVKHPQFGLGRLQWLRRNSKTNGYDRAFRKVGKEVYVNNPLFAECVLGSE